MNISRFHGYDGTHVVLHPAGGTSRLQNVGVAHLNSCFDLEYPNVVSTVDHNLISILIPILSYMFSLGRDPRVIQVCCVLLICLFVHLYIPFSQYYTVTIHKYSMWESGAILASQIVFHL